ncbi:hypothetical protein, partial [Enterococcus faecalis]|uniref:hypothetical protein n=1 Tax=Enterococcus faecalis TaxID=1351 RepID=UPI003CC69317
GKILSSRKSDSRIFANPRAKNRNRFGDLPNPDNELSYGKIICAGSKHDLINRVASHNVLSVGWKLR